MAGMSFGVAHSHGNLNARDCLIEADLKMYQYKDAKKNQKSSVGV